MKIVVVCGGVSTEREVSLKSGRAVYNALLRIGYSDVELFDLQKDNLSELLSLNPDIVYLALHGKGGEDGCIQGMLELSGIPYTGSGVETSAVCMNKIITKQVLKSYNLPTADFEVYTKEECNNRLKIADSIVSSVGLPVVLKSPCEGSSIGVVIANSKEEIIDAMLEIFKYGETLLAEEFLEGIELTLPIVGNEDIITYPIVEITSERLFYDYTAKYTSGLCHHITPARISEKERMTIESLGKSAYKRLNCRGLSRIDFIIDKNKGPMIIEINTLPGMTEMSLFPDSTKTVGLTFDDLVDKIIKLGIDAHKKQ